jgi:hypothetical protein
MELGDKSINEKKALERGITDDRLSNDNDNRNIPRHHQEQQRFKRGGRTDTGNLKKLKKNKSFG